MLTARGQKGESAVCSLYLMRAIWHFDAAETLDSNTRLLNNVILVRLVRLDCPGLFLIADIEDVHLVVG